MKKWYQSKIVLLALALLALIFSNVATGWLTGQGVTDLQLEAIQIAYPDLAASIKQLQDGQNFFQWITGIATTLFGVWRVWFTGTKIE